MEKHEHVSGYIEIIPYIYAGISKCCRPTFAQVEGKKTDINFEGKLNIELLSTATNFIASLIKQKIKIYIAHENKKWAEKCQKWCKENKSCNLEITKHSLNVKGGKTKEWTKL